MSYNKPTIVDKTPKLTKYNNGGKRSKTTKIAWHYTGMAGAKAINTINNWFNAITNGYKQNGKYLYASSHYLCDLDGTIYSYIPENYIAYTTNQANSYSIGIECATIGSDDHYPDVEYKSMVKLGAYLADKYNLDPRKDFIRHYDVTGKICPRYFVNNIKAWNRFKQDCYDELHSNDNIVNKLENKKSYDFKTTCKVTAKSGLNIRDSRPTNETLGKKLFTVPYGKTLTVGYVLNDWAYINYNGKYGFANINYLQIV